MFLGRIFGKSDGEIIAWTLGKCDSEYLHKQIIVVNRLAEMGSCYGFDSQEGICDNMAFLGFSAILQHFPDSQAAQRWMQMEDDVVTIGDLWSFFVKENDINPESVRYKPGYDHTFFTWLLQQDLASGYGFGLSLTACLAESRLPEKLAGEYNSFLNDSRSNPISEG